MIINVVENCRIKDLEKNWKGIFSHCYLEDKFSRSIPSTTMFFNRWEREIPWSKGQIYKCRSLTWHMHLLKRKVNPFAELSCNIRQYFHELPFSPIQHILDQEIHLKTEKTGSNRDQDLAAAIKYILHIYINTNNILNFKQ